MSEIHYGRGYVYSIQSHLVWCVKYRHEVLYGQVDINVKQLLKQIADDDNIQIIEYADKFVAMTVGRLYVHETTEEVIQTDVLKSVVWYGNLNL